MTIATGTRLGPYEILAPLGVGGMGEVYRAHDSRLGRDVAIKVLSPHLAAAPEVRARFEREARTISQLNHPHICTLHDIGHQDGVDYLVMELLEGDTLAHRLEKGPLPVAEVLTLGTQIADALDRAHRAGVVHRDLKPGNVMLTKGGAKLMDFGLARAAVAAGPPGALTESPTVSRPLTAEGTIVGTFQYMAPEQLEGKEADARTDLWALGCVLYEMATGKRAFEGHSQASLISAIMKDEPRLITELQPRTPPPLEHLVRRCLAKDADRRWQGAGDLARELEWVATGGSQVGAPAPVVSRRDHAFTVRAIIAVGLAAALLAIGGFLASRLREHRPAHLSFTRLTFQRGVIGNARFTPDGRSVLYSAAWDGRPTEVFETRPDLSTGRSLGMPGIFLHAVSHSGELALGRDAGWYNIRAYGALAVAPGSGSAPRDLLPDVSWADWSPDGRALALVRRVGGQDRLEMPPGHVLVKTSGWFGDLRVSPDGRRIAFTEHSVVGDARGSVAVVEMAGHKKTLTGELPNVQGLAWSPSGREIWFSGAAGGMRQGLFAVTLKGHLRTVAQFPVSVVLKDLAPGGRVVLASRRQQTGIRGRSFADEKERELGWLDFPWPRALSSDGKMLLLEDEGETGGPNYAVYLRNMDGSPPVRLGEGAGCALSPDGRWALTILYGTPHRLVLIPTGSGDTLSVPHGRVETYQSASWLADGRRIVFVGAERGRPQRTWVQELHGGLPSAVTPEGTVGVTTSADGRWVAAVAPDSTLMLHPLQGGEPRSVGRLDSQDEVSQWSADGRTLFVGRPGVRLDVFGVDVQSGARRLWKTFEVPDPAGVHMLAVLITRDARSHAYAYLRFLDELYLVEGLK
jgi:Tol biopolymer transport system component